MDRLVFWIYRLAATLVAPATIEQVFRAGECLGLIGYYLAAPYRLLVLRNLKIAFGGERPTHQLEQIARQQFATLGANFLCNLKLPQMSANEILARVTVEGLETMELGQRDGRGFVMVISHIGNWELFAQLAPLLFPCKTGTLYQRLGNPWLDAQVRRDRARVGLELFEPKEGSVRASQFIRSGAAVGVLIDQHAGDAGLWCPFFGRLASTSTLAATLALRTGALISSAVVHTEGCARWRMSIVPPIASDGLSVATLTARFNELLEAQIRSAPADWFWVHNRWKTPQPKFLLATYKRGLVRPEPPVKLKPFRILIRSSNWLGDAVMSVPAVAAIKHGRPDAQITILTRAKLADFWRAVAEVDQVITIENPETVFDVARKIRGIFDVAIVFPNSLRTALEVWLAKIPRRVGYAGKHRRALLNQVFPEKKRASQKGIRHQVHEYLQLAEFCGAEVQPAILSLQPRVKRTPAPLPVVGVCPGAEYGPAKRWLPERFAEVMRVVGSTQRCDWKMFGVEKDRPVAEQILQAAVVPCIDLVGKTTLSELMAELRRCDLLLTNDTGTMHLAAFLGVPTVALFGSTEPALTGPLGPQHRVIRHHVECSPCFLRDCPIDFRCMKAISVPEVVAAIERVLGDLRAPVAA